jgi:hypothetical protein
MTALVLALAGLTCGDGGTDMGAATATVAVSLEGEWEGVEECRWGTCRVDLRRGVLRYFDRAGTVTRSDRIRIDGKGTVSILGSSGQVWGGIFRMEGPRLLICTEMIASIIGTHRPTTFRVGPDTVLFTLRPAGPPQP